MSSNSNSNNNSNNNNNNNSNLSNVTKIRINKSAEDVYEAFADPDKLTQFWFSGSARLEQGRTFTWRYEEYNAEVPIYIAELSANERIVFRWGGEDGGNFVTIIMHPEQPTTTVVEVIEAGFDPSADSEELRQAMIDNKEGWTYMLTCLKGYLEYGAKLRAALVK
ncbi:uncharacterized protein YndB with AHSA1/START domain [Paenibacillus taihuensis]|uniref:Uncharacterized protein YndB with AHSA1/START domain n=1 Tax=Paenibacillus taihuensis TaxID=1156355 RepID=A0A3D9SK43_9BACL|nr:SRPBCC domain-containing protein [Paenibacillus taihuensis]REE90673.1 uncharacterized protein YndB with AHSA1/START domain [Paenibacillus taihuensis]